MIAPQATNHSLCPYSFLAPAEENEPWLTSAIEVVGDAVNTVISSGIKAENINVKSIQFRKVSLDYDYDFHHAPRRQYIVLLNGGVEIETSLGIVRRFQTADILLVEDNTGKGHRTKNLEKRERTSIFIHLD